MRTIVLRLAAALTGAVLSLGAAHAARQDFTLVNKTGYDIAKVFVSAAGDKNWGDDIMGKDTLDNGESVDIVFDKGDRQCKWDLMVVYTDNDEAVWPGVDLCRTHKITIFWDRRAKVSRATFD